MASNKDGSSITYDTNKQTDGPVAIIYDTESAETKITGKNLGCYRYCVIIWMSYNLATFQFLPAGLTEFLCLNIKEFKQKYLWHMFFYICISLTGFAV